MYVKCVVITGAHTQEIHKLIPITEGRIIQAILVVWHVEEAGAGVTIPVELLLVADGVAATTTTAITRGFVLSKPIPFESFLKRHVLS